MQQIGFKPTPDKSLIGAAGVHFVVSQLSLRGLIALPTIRNTFGTDIIVINRDGTRFANLQVKTSRSRVSFWPVGTQYDSWTGPNNHYVFLRWVRREGTFEVFLESAKSVAVEVAKTVARERARRGGRSWGPCFHLRDQADRLRQQWMNFGIAHTSRDPRPA